MTDPSTPDDAGLRARRTEGQYRVSLNSASLDFKRGDQEKK